MTRYVVTGRFTPTDANPITDAQGPVVKVSAETLKEAKVLALWYRMDGRDGKIRDAV